LPQKMAPFCEKCF